MRHFGSLKSIKQMPFSFEGSSLQMGSLIAFILPYGVNSCLISSSVVSYGMFLMKRVMLFEDFNFSLIFSILVGPLAAMTSRYLPSSLVPFKLSALLYPDWSI